MDIRRLISDKLFFAGERDLAELYLEALVEAGYEAKLDEQESGNMWVTVWTRPGEEKATNEEGRSQEVEA